MIIDCISDLHGERPQLKGGDVLIIAGDCTSNDKVPTWTDFLCWLNVQDYKYKIIVAGNHDNFCTQWANSNDSIYDIIEDKNDFIYLCDVGVEIEGLKIWGSPWTLWFHGINPHCKAFIGDEKFLKFKYDFIPSDTDILITHSPPYGILDEIKPSIFDQSKADLHCGSKSLRNQVLDSSKLPKLKAHIFGHIHEGYGQMIIKRPGFGDENNITCVNASIMNANYEPVNNPIRITL